MVNGKFFVLFLLNIVQRNNSGDRATHNISVKKKRFNLPEGINGNKWRR